MLAVEFRWKLGNLYCFTRNNARITIQEITNLLSSAYSFSIPLNWPQIIYPILVFRFGGKFRNFFFFFSFFLFFFLIWFGSVLSYLVRFSSTLQIRIAACSRFHSFAWFNSNVCNLHGADLYERITHVNEGSKGSRQNRRIRNTNVRISLK